MKKNALLLFVLFCTGLSGHAISSDQTEISGCGCKKKKKNQAETILKTDLFRSKSINQV
jgi:hypothetical protein